MFSYITSFFENPKAMLMFILLALPGRIRFCIWVRTV